MRITRRWHTGLAVATIVIFTTKAITTDYAVERAFLIVMIVGMVVWIMTLFAEGRRGAKDDGTRARHAP